MINQFPISQPNIQGVGPNNNNKNKIEEIISSDNVKELQDLIQEKENNITSFKTVITSFREIEEMKMPLIQFCVLKNAIECFKYLLVNGYDDPKKTMKEQNPNPEMGWSLNNNGTMEMKEIRRYEWDCMATAIYYGNKEIVKILEEKEFEKGKNPSHIEAAILSFRNTMVDEILEKIEEEKDVIKNILSFALLTSAKNNNIRVTELLISKGTNINSNDIIY